MASNVKNLKLTSYDELFGAPPQNGIENVPDDMQAAEIIVEMPLELIDNFKDHPYKVRLDRITSQIVKDIERTGTLQHAGIVRPKPDGRYELISGNRRNLACQIAKRPTMPVVIRELSDDEAIIAMVSSNTQREDVLPSEKAFAYKMRMEAESRQGKRNDLTSRPMVEKLNTTDLIGEEHGESGRQVQRYIRLTELIPEILEMVDRKFIKSKKMEIELDNENDDNAFQKGISFRPAVELSYLSKDLQRELYDIMQTEECTPSQSQAEQLKEAAKNGKLDRDEIKRIMVQEKPNQKEIYKLPQERLAKYFPKGTTPAKVEETIIKALDFYYKRLERLRQERERER